MPRNFKFCFRSDNFLSTFHEDPHAFEPASRAYSLRVYWGEKCTELCRKGRDAHFVMAT